MTKTGILHWKIKNWEFRYCNFGVIHKGPVDEMTTFEMTLQTRPQVGCDAIRGVVYTRELRISEESFLNLNEDREWNILTREGPRTMYSQGFEHWARDFFAFLEIEN